QNGRNRKDSDGKKKNGGSVKKEDECHNPSLPLKNGSKGKKNNMKNGGLVKNVEEVMIFHIVIFLHLLHRNTILFILLFSF
ncbi:hypothetical protein L195_g051633, partial [Trifolium pratense]